MWLTRLSGAVLVLAAAFILPAAAEQPLISPYRAAELNGYPGPRHVLEAVEAGQMRLTTEQLTAARRIFDAMSVESKRIGEAILRDEQALEVAFGAARIDEAELRARVARIATLRGELRVVHLRAHLETRALLSDPQVQRYNEIRGYARGEAGQGEHKH